MENRKLIRVVITTIEGTGIVRSFDSVEKAREFARKYVGEKPEIGSTCAISVDGVCRAEVYNVSLHEIFYLCWTNI